MSNPAFIQGGKTVVPASTASVAFTSPNTQGSLLIAVIRTTLASAAANTVSDNNHNTWQKLDSAGVASSNQIWYALSANSGANTVSLATGGLATSIELLIGEYGSGAAGSVLALDAHHVATGSSSTPASGNCTTNFANDLLIGWTGNDTGTTITAGLIGGGTALLQENQSQVCAYEDNNAANNTAGLNAASFGGSQTTWVCGIAAFAVEVFSISGNAGIAGATVAWSGTSSGSTTADGSGNYTISGLADGPYTITPSFAGYTFSPTSQAKTVSGSNITGVNFTATQTSASGKHSTPFGTEIFGAQIQSPNTEIIGTGTRTKITK